VIAIYVFQDHIPFAEFWQLFFLSLSVLMFVIIFIPWILRWFLHFDQVKADLHHPVFAAFYPTMPISLIIIGLALEKAGHLFLPEEILLPTLQFLWLTGTAGIAYFALTILNINFMKPGVDLKIANMGWLIPPVSALIVPILGGSLSVEYAGTTLGNINLVASLIFLGVGSLLFIFVMGAVFTRYISHSLLPAHLAPTIWIGIAPTAILTIISVKLTHPLIIFFNASSEVAEVFGIISKAIGVGFWGFAFFWLILAISMTVKHHKKIEIPFAMSWWAFTFPLESFIVSTGVIYKAIGGSFFLVIGLTALVAFFVIWGTVLVKTIKRVISGEIFEG
ncbi:MAG: hypothetical protein HOG15_00475, partial [Anaerolineae bacterium]|nr:hypothetical protein [Anaerolineae bacterium]